MDIIVEIFLELYMELMMLVVPQENVGKKHRVIASLIAVVVTLGLLALGVWGVVLIVEQDNLLGIIPIVIAVLLSLAQIIAGILLYKKKH